MKFLIMLNGTQADYDALAGRASEGRPAWSPEDLKAMFQHMNAINGDLAAAGELIEGQGLVEPKRARAVTAAPDGTPVVSDVSPEATRQELAGYWLVDVPNAERAYEIAARAYAAPQPEGTIEPPPVIVRPVEEGEVGQEA
jgi:hypothetical protein